jgi:hypothetical protein
MIEQIIIHRRFNGPPNSGHGGYVSGVLANYISSCAEVTLRAPPPLDRPLAIERLESGIVHLLDGEVTIAEGWPAKLQLNIPDPPTLEESAIAAKAYPGFEEHPFPTCFGCGHERAEGDGLRIFSGTVTGSEVLAAPWLPDASLAGQTGRVRNEFLWAAMDCPGGWTAWKIKTVLFPEAPYILLARFVAEVKAGLEPGQNCMIISWLVGNDSRKLFSGSAILSESGELVAAGETTWIVVQ